MNRLQNELRRLYLVPEGTPGGQVRAAVLQVCGPGAWGRLAPAWQGVQADLELPAPAIAAGGDGLQLWFSFADPIAAEQAQALLAALRSRYLAEVPPDRIRVHLEDLPALPPVEIGPERWSAFVAPDLAALFSDDAWLDLAPGVDAQAELLSRVQPMQSRDFQRALERVAPAQQDAAPPSPGTRHADPKAFLLSVMNDGSVAMPLRIEAARALLPYFENPRPR